MGTVHVDELAGVRLCGFALAFDLLAKASTFVFNAKSSNCISEVSCSLLSQVRENVTCEGVLFTESMAERSGRANSVRSRTFGRDGVAGDVVIRIPAALYGK